MGMLDQSSAPLVVAAIRSSQSSYRVRDLGPAAPAAPLRRTAVVRPVLGWIARLLDQVARDRDGVVHPPDMAQAGAEPLVVVCVVVDLERHDPVADHVGMIDPGRAFLLIGGVGITFELGVGVAGHVPGVGDTRGGLGVKRRRLLGADRLGAVPEVDAVMMAPGCIGST